MSARVTFLPAGVETEGQIGESLFAVGRRAGVDIETACVGQATCGLCRVKIEGGEEHLVPPGDADEKHLGNVYFLTRVRLSCQAVIAGDGEIVVALAPKRRRKKK